MNQSTKKARRAERIGCAREKGFTLMEVLIALAVLAVIIAITAGALGGRATDTQLGGVANQVAASIQSRQLLFVNGLRDANMSVQEVAGLLGTVFEDSDIIDPPATGFDTNSSGTYCNAATGNGIEIDLVPTALDANEAIALQALIQSSVNDLFDGIAATDPGGYQDVFGYTTSTGPETGATATATEVHLCLGS